MIVKWQVEIKLSVLLWDTEAQVGPFMPLCSFLSLLSLPPVIVKTHEFVFFSETFCHQYFLPLASSCGHWCSPLWRSPGHKNLKTQSPLLAHKENFALYFCSSHPVPLFRLGLCWAHRNGGILTVMILCDKPAK